MSDLHTHQMVADQREIVYRRCHRLVSMARIPNAEDVAEDLTQDTLIKACSSLRNFRGTCQLSSWLCTIATTIFLDHLRYTKTKKHLTTESKSILPQNQ
ncbi:hypothetical protein KW791_01915 [Candidatus Parcubacteria bacterium]|nr:hypothetical protein [Candidatus Parcubacteria bacterium]